MAPKNDGGVGAEMLADYAALYRACNEAMLLGALLSQAARVGIDGARVRDAYQTEGLVAAHEMFGYLYAEKLVEDGRRALRDQEGIG